MNVSPLNNSSSQIIDYIHDLKWSDIPTHVKHQATRCLLDTIGVFYGGTYTDLSKIIYDFATVAYGGSQAKLWLDGRSVSLPGAALAHGMTIDALDLHDSCKEVKGHVGDKEGLVGELSRRLMGYWVAKDVIDRGKFKTPKYEAFEEYQKILKK